jgi:hypothetical protein
MLEGLGSSVCCLLRPYSTISFKNKYGGQNCAVIFAAGSSPQLFPGEEPPEMGQFPVIIEKPCVSIDPTLRLDFSSVYTIEHNAKVRNVGRIDRKYLKELKSAFAKATKAKSQEDGSPRAEFEIESAGEDEVLNFAESNSDRFMIDKMSAPFQGHFASSTSPSHLAGKYTHNMSLVYDGGIPRIPTWSSFAASVLPNYLARRYTLNDQVVDNIANPTAGSSMRFGSSNDDTSRPPPPVALSLLDEDLHLHITTPHIEGPLHRGMDRLG